MQARLVALLLATQPEAARAQALHELQVVHGMHRHACAVTRTLHLLVHRHCTCTCTYATPTHAAHTLHTRCTHAAHTRRIRCTYTAPSAPAHINNNIISNSNSHPACRSRGGGASSTRCSLPACRRGGASSMPPPRSLLLLGLGLARGRVCTSGSRAKASSYRRVTMNAGVVLSTVAPFPK